VPESHSFSEHVLHDKDIRGPLFDFLERTYGRIRIIEEKMSGRARADAVMVMPDQICGIEIKSDADTYARLAGQVKNYDLYYDMNFVVVGTRHAMHIEEHVPPYWGIITVEAVEASALDFYMLRHPKPNPNMKPEKKISILWRPELAHIQALDEMPAYKYLSKADVAKKILERVPEETLRQQISGELFERDYTTIGDEILAYRKAAHPGKRVRRRRKRYRVT
jgi:hypothetical protein